jgi:hypothetical protein
MLACREEEVAFACIARRAGTHALVLRLAHAPRSLERSRQGSADTLRQQCQARCHVTFRKGRNADRWTCGLADWRAVQQSNSPTVQQSIYDSHMVYSDSPFRSRRGSLLDPSSSTSYSYLTHTFIARRLILPYPIASREAAPVP